MTIRSHYEQPTDLAKIDLSRNLLKNVYFERSDPLRKAIILKTEVLGDGYGDLFNTLYAARLVKEQNRQLPCFIIAISQHASHPPINYSQFCLSEKDIVIIDAKDTPMLKVADRILSLKTAQDSKVPMILQNLRDFCQNHNHLQCSISTNARLNDDLGFLKEYGGYTRQSSMHGQDGFSHYAMGVGPYGIGIHTPRIEIPNAFINPVLSELFEGRAVFFNYGRDNIKHFIQVIGSLHQGDLYVITRTIHQDLSWVEAFGIGSVFINNRKEYESKPNIHPRSLYLFRFNILDHSDMIRCMSLAAPPIGTTGNCTFSETIMTTDHVVFDDGYCLDFWNGMMDLALKTERENPLLIQYFVFMRALKKKRGEIPPNPITSDNFDKLQTEWKQFKDRLIADYSIKPYFLGMLKQLEFRQSPVFKEEEFKLFQEFHHGRISKEQCLSGIEQLIAQHIHSS